MLGSRDDQFRPRREGRFNIEHNDGCLVDEFYDSLLINAMRSIIANAQRDRVNAIGQFTGPSVVDIDRERYTVGWAVCAVPTHEAGVFNAAIEVTRPCPNKSVVVQIPRVRSIEQNSAL